MGMGMKSLKWEGIGTKNLFPHTSSSVSSVRLSCLYASTRPVDEERRHYFVGLSVFRCVRAVSLMHLYHVSLYHVGLSGFRPHRVPSMRMRPIVTAVTWSLNIRVCMSVSLECDLC